MIILRNFNRKFTIIRLPQFGQPVVADIQALELPRGSIFHYLPSDVREVGPVQTLPILTKAEKLMQVNHNLVLTTEVIGKPIAVPVNIQKDILLYHRKNMRIRRMREETTVLRDDRTLLIENYAPLNMLYRYNETQMSWYDRWYNVYSTFISRLQYDTRRFEGRQNYTFLELPNVIPPIAMLRRAERTRNVSTLKNIREDSQLRLLDLWTWLGPNRDGSDLARLTPEQIRRVNIVLTYKGKFVNLNLGELDFWRMGGTNPKAPVNPLQMQRRLFITITRLAQEATNAEADARKRQLAEMAKQDAAKETLDTAEREGENEADDLNSDEVVVDPTAVKQAGLAIGEGDEADDTPVIDDTPEAIEAEIAKYDELEIDEEAAFEIIATTKESDGFYEEEYDFNRPMTHEEGVMRECERYITSGALTTRDYQRAQKLASTWRTLPGRNGQPMEEYIKPSTEELAIQPVVMTEDAVGVYDKSMLQTTIKEINRKYNGNVLHRDVAAVSMAIQRAGFMVLNYEVERILDAANCDDLYSIKVATVNGKESTLRFTLPALDEDGYWKSNDVDYTMRKQRVDIPIRKTAPDTVTITSFYGKNFIRRCEKSVADWNGWLTNNIIAMSRNKDNTTVSEVKYSNVFNPDHRLPRDYTTLSTQMSGFKSNAITFNFDISKIEELYGKEIVDELAEQEMIPVGKAGATVYAMDQYSTVYRRAQNGSAHAVGTIGEIVGLDLEKAPKEYTELSIMGKAIPIGLIFCYYFGLERALRLFKIPYRVADTSERIAPASSDLVMKMVDAKLVVSPATYEQRLMINGMARYIKLMRDFTLRDLNERDVYLNLIQKDGLSVRYLQELDLMDTMFIDPITERQLVAMNEPTTFRGLLKRANEMLTVDQHPDEINADYMHYYTSQRMAGAAYVELVRAIREYHAKPGTAKKLEMHPTAVWQNIAQDGSIAPASDATPIHSIKEATVITYGGNGGRSRRSMVKHTRRYLKEDLGVLSGDVVDNGDVGMTAYLAANPMIVNVDGYADKDRAKKLNIGSILSPAQLMAPGVLFDDGKRGNFVGIQMGSTTSCVGGEVPSVRTGEEIAWAHLCRNTQTVPAEGPGKVLEISEHTIKVAYKTKDGVKEKVYRLGRHFGRHEGGIYPQAITPNVKVGATFKKGDILTYNAMHFEPDMFNPTQVAYKPGPIVNALFIESNDTIEDSSAIDKETSNLLATSVSKPLYIFSKFTDTITNLVKLGTEIDPETILCTIEDEITANVDDAYSEESKKTLESISDKSPRAGIYGVAERIEVFYNGQIEDMSKSLQAIARAGDRVRKAEAEVSPDTISTNGQCDSSLRLDGRPVELGTMVIRIYVSHNSTAIGGDKCVVANQMKSTFRRRMVGRNYADNGRKINLIFGRKSCDERIVTSIYQIGTLTTWGRLVSERCREMVAKLG